MLKILVRIFSRLRFYEAFHSTNSKESISTFNLITYASLSHTIAGIKQPWPHMVLVMPWKYSRILHRLACVGTRCSSKGGRSTALHRVWTWVVICQQSNRQYLHKKSPTLKDLLQILAFATPPVPAVGSIRRRHCPRLYALFAVWPSEIQLIQVTKLAQLGSNRPHSSK